MGSMFVSPQVSYVESVTFDAVVFGGEVFGGD